MLRTLAHTNLSDTSSSHPYQLSHAQRVAIRAAADNFVSDNPSRPPVPSLCLSEISSALASLPFHADLDYQSFLANASATFPSLSTKLVGAWFQVRKKLVIPEREELEKENIPPLREDTAGALDHIRRASAPVRSQARFSQPVSSAQLLLDVPQSPRSLHTRLDTLASAPSSPSAQFSSLSISSSAAGHYSETVQPRLSEDFAANNASVCYSQSSLVRPRKHLRHDSEPPLLLRKRSRINDQLGLSDNCTLRAGDGLAGGQARVPRGNEVHRPVLERPVPRCRCHSIGKHDGRDSMDVDASSEAVEVKVETADGQIHRRRANDFERPVPRCRCHPGGEHKEDN